MQASASGFQLLDTSLGKLVNSSGSRYNASQLVKSCIGTKFTSQFGDLIADLAIEATTTVGVEIGQGLTDVDIKNYIKVEKVPGGQLEDSRVLKGVMIKKDVQNVQKVVNPHIILLDSPLEYKKGENQTNVELLKEEDWILLLKMEEEYIEQLCMHILKFKPDLRIDAQDRGIMLGLVKSCIPRFLRDLRVDAQDRGIMLGLVKSCIGTKFTGQFGDLIADLAIEATTTVGVEIGQGLTDVDMHAEDWILLLKIEEEYIEELCMQILKFKPDLVILDQGLTDLATHYLSKHGVSAMRRLSKSDNNRIAKASARPDELQESDVGTGAGLFEVNKIGEEYFSYIVNCKEPKACTILLRGASKDLLNEVERNPQDAMSVARNIIKNPKLVPRGGAIELTVLAGLKQKSSSIEGIEKCPYEAAAVAFEAIPRTLAQNCGVNVIRTMTGLQGKHANRENYEGWQGSEGTKSSCMLLRIHDIVSGMKKKQAPGAPPSKLKVETEADADSEQILAD
ncbi:T-complex protein 1 subunit gamma [Glycine soja]